MECYGTIYFENVNEDFKLTNFVKDLAVNNHELGIEGSDVTNNSITSIDFIGGSDTDNCIVSIMSELNAKDIKFVKGYWTGDEEPFIELLWVCKDTGKIDSSAISDGIFEMLSEIECEEEIEDSKELKEAYTKGPKIYFESKYNKWVSGLESQNLDQAKDLLDSVISSSEYMVN